MNYSIDKGDKTRSVRFEGMLTHPHQGQFLEVLDNLADASGCAIEIDLSGLTAIDSTGLGLLLMINDRAHKADSTVALKAPHGKVKHTLELAKLDEVFALR